MSCLVHLSDLHFGRHCRKRQACLLDCLQDVLPDLIVITGDLTQRAKPSQFRGAKSFLDGLGASTLVIPGNHDMPLFNLVERFRDPWRRWRRYISRCLEPTHHDGRIAAVGVTTPRPYGPYMDWSRGRIHPLQIRRVRDQLRSVPYNTLKIVAAHHPFWLPESHSHRRLVMGETPAMDAFLESGVDLILGGHIHHAYVRVVRGMIVLHSGTSLSHRLDPGIANSFNAVSGDRKALDVCTWEWNGSGFYPSGEHRFRRGEKGWTRIDTPLL